MLARERIANCVARAEELSGQRNFNAAGNFENVSLLILRDLVRAETYGGTPPSGVA